MTTVIISGSRSVKALPQSAIESLDKIIELGFEVLVGDAIGVDLLVQQHLKQRNYTKVTVYYCLFKGKGKPRNSLFENMKGIYGDYFTRDEAMCKKAEFGLAIWDGTSIGTELNIQRVPKTKVIKVQYIPE